VLDLSVIRRRGEPERRHARAVQDLVGTGNAGPAEQLRVGQRPLESLSRWARVYFARPGSSWPGSEHEAAQTLDKRSKYKEPGLAPFPGIGECPHSFATPAVDVWVAAAPATEAVVIGGPSVCAYYSDASYSTVIGARGTGCRGEVIAWGDTSPYVLCQRLYCLAVLCPF
jgi:hypothetical protein